MPFSGGLSCRSTYPPSRKVGPRPVPGKHPVARPRVNTQTAQGHRPWLEPGEVGREVEGCRGRGYTLAAAHCIKDPGLWGWRLGSSQSCHLRMGLCLPARQKEKKEALKDGTAKPPHMLVPVLWAHPSFQREPVNQEQRASPRQCGLSPQTWAQIPWPTVTSPTHRVSLQQEQYSNSMTRKQLSSKALGRTSFRLRPGVLRRDNTAST